MPHLMNAPALARRAARAAAAGNARAAEKALRELSAFPVERLLDHGEFDIPTPPPAELLAAMALFLKARPRAAWGWALKAFALRGLFRYEEATAAMERAVRLEPRSPALHAVLSRVRFAGTLPRAALEDLDRALTLAPGCGWVLAWRGEALRQLGRLPEARRDLEEAVRRAPRYAHAWGWLGGTLRRLGEAGAEAALRRGLALDRGHAWTWHELFLLLKSADPARAARALDRAHALNPRCDWLSGGDRSPAAYRRAAAEAERAYGQRKTPSLAFWAAHSRLEAGEAGRALDWARRAPRGPRTLALKARASAALGREPGERELTAALRLDPGFAHAWAWRGRAKLARGDASGAVRDLDRALALDPVCAWGHLLRARGRAALGRRGPAREDAVRALAIHAGYGEARDFLKSLGRDS